MTKNEAVKEIARRIRVYRAKKTIYRKAEITEIERIYQLKINELRYCIKLIQKLKP